MANMPNLKFLNLNYNFLDNLDGLKGLRGLKKLTVVGNRLGGSGTKAVVRGLNGLGGLEEIDLRQVRISYTLQVSRLTRAG